MKKVWGLFNRSSTGVKVAILTVIGIWVIAMAAVIIGITLVWESPTEAQLPVPEAGLPSITLEPTSGSSGTPVTVRGQNWSPGSTVLIYLAAPDEISPPSYAIASVVPDPAGEFLVTVLIPAEPRWETIGTATIIAREVDSESVTQASFALVDPARQPTATVTTTLEATPTSTVTVGSPTPTPTSEPGTPMVTAATNVNIRRGPGTAYPVLGLLQVGQNAEITGISPDSSWWQIKFSGATDERGWVAANYVTAQNTGNIPVVQTPAVPSQPTPVVITDWRGEYYNNPSLSGAPAAVRNDGSINFDWGNGAPVAVVGADNFSARWTRSLSFPAGTYRFFARADDGVRLWIDDKLVIDQWHDSAPTTHTADVFLSSGTHLLKMEYYERSGSALAQLTWEWFENYPDWRGEYFGNASMTGAPALVRNDLAINFNWGPSAPAAGLPADNFSVRWTRDQYFTAGNYRFGVLVDDGVRLWVDDKLVIDRWRQGPPSVYTGEVNLTDGTHRLRLEYFEYRYDAQVRLDWERIDSYPDWKAEYFDNRKLEGKPVLVRNETQIDHIWGTGSPGTGIPADNFSARWARKINFEAGTYLLRVKVDDGVRLWVDDVLVIDSWQDGKTRTLEAERQVSQGQHRLKVEYYERGGDAQIEVSWQKINKPANQPPEPILGGSYTVDEGSLVTLDGRASQDPDGQIVKYEWNFNYNGSLFVTDATGPTASTRYADGPATFTVALRVTDDKGLSQMATTQVKVQNVAPTVEAGGPYTGSAGSPITLAGTATDPGTIDQAGLTYRWQLGDGSEAQGPVVSHSYAQEGTYTVKLIVTDKDGANGSDTAIVQVTAVNQPPQATISGPSSGFADDPLSFSGGESRDPDGTITDYVWDFGDGTTGSGANVDHTYNAAGTYKVTLTVTDDDGLSASTTLLVDVSEPL